MEIARGKKCLFLAYRIGGDDMKLRERERFAQGVTVEPLSNATFAVYPMLVLPEKSKSEMTGMGKRKLQYGNKTSTD